MARGGGVASVVAAAVVVAALMAAMVAAVLMAVMKTAASANLNGSGTEFWLGFQSQTTFSEGKDEVLFACMCSSFNKEYV